LGQCLTINTLRSKAGSQSRKKKRGKGKRKEEERRGEERRGEERRGEEEHKTEQKNLHSTLHVKVDKVIWTNCSTK
jgi:hypothetical protein